ncbi:hypothetical protein TWF696_003820 [Orbilia brochopaga]|uniref:Uncharacterized protein n=1 Tax=Orbilia brochopaga TaxID=3140254 RepID=A0AAV9V7A5_9PEZI
MQFSTSFIAAAAAFLPLVSSHVVMVQPVPYQGTRDNSPLDASGSNFPCKFPGGVGQKTAPASGDTYTPGQASTFTLQGSAVHGGGSCQASITYDNPPTKNSVFKVVQSYEGGCPVSTAGNLGDNSAMGLPAIPVTLPAGLKAGEAVFVWTWFNRIGNREMYMNCAPITIGGSSTSDDVFNSLPNMFVANIANAPGNACTTKESVDIVFPNAGKNVKVVDGNQFAAACPGGPSAPGSSSGGSGGSPAPPAASPSTTQIPSVVTAPALIGGPAVDVSTGIIGTSFSEVAPAPAPTSSSQMMMPSPVQSTTMMTVSTPAAAPVMPTPMKPSTTMAAAPQPTQGNGGGNSTGGGFATGPCDSSKTIIMCGSDPSTYIQCFDNNMAYGPFSVPPGTMCDSTGMGGFRAVKAVSSRFVRRNLGRHHKRSFHSHRF